MAASTSEDGADDRVPLPRFVSVRLALCQSAYNHFFHLKKK